MASREVPACGRCSFGKEKPATRTRSFSIDGEHFKINVCDVHDAMLDRDIGAWTSYAYDDESYQPPRAMFTAEIIERQRKAAELRGAAAPGEQHTLPVVPDTPVIPIGASRVATQWSLTFHARERMIERGYTQDEVLAAALHPDTVIESDPKYGPDVRTYRKGDVLLAVVPERKLVISCLPREHDLSYRYDRASSQ